MLTKNPDGAPGEERALDRDLRQLASDLAALDSRYAQFLADNVDPVELDRAAAVEAVRAVNDFLRRHDVRSDGLWRLETALNSLNEDGNAAMLLSKNKEGGRRPDSWQVQVCRGRIAAVAFLWGCCDGMENADKEIAKYLSKTPIALRFSQKPIGMRTVRLWRSTFGKGVKGKTPEELLAFVRGLNIDSDRESFLASFTRSRPVADWRLMGGRRGLLTEIELDCGLVVTDGQRLTADDCLDAILKYALAITLPAPIGE